MDALIQIVPCLSRIECEEVLDDIVEDAYRPSTMFSGSASGSLVVDDRYRSSTSYSLSDEGLAASKLHEAINASLLEYRDNLVGMNTVFDGFPIPGGQNVRCYREPIQVIRYRANQRYEFHRDAADDLRLREHRRSVSVIVYLKEDFTGGGTEFVGRTFKPAQGEALIFPSAWTHPHRGQPVKSGEKIIAVTWYYSELQR